MERFLKNFLRFCIPFVAFILLTVAIIYLNARQVEKRIGEIAQHETLLMGDSQSQRLRGDLLNSSAVHFGSPAEHCYFTFNKLRRVFEQKDHAVKQVILTVSIHNFSPMLDRMIDSDYAEGKNSVNKHMYFLPVEDLIVEGNLRPWDLSGNKLLKGIYGGPYWGGQRVSRYSDPDSAVIAKTLDAQFTMTKDQNRFSVKNKEYLLKIDSLCKAEEVALYVVSTPYHTVYISQIEEDYKKFFYNTMSQLQHAQHIDYLGEVPDTKWMSDANHLNETGAKLYTLRLNEQIRNNSLKNIRQKKVYMKSEVKNM